MARRQFILSIDQGTTSSRAILFGPDRSIEASAQIEITQSYPRSGWVEHDPEEIWRSVCETVRAVLHKAGVAAAEVAGIGIANQRETVVVWDRSDGVPIHPAIVWQDRRTSETCEVLRESGAESWVRDKTGLLLDPYFSATKLAWMLDRVDGARERAAKGELAAGTIDTFLLWRLTGGGAHRTDATNASRTQLFDIREGNWADELCSLFRVPRVLLPEVCDNASVFGITLPELFGAPIPILGMAGDQQSAALGQACFSAGNVKATFGTGCFILLNTGPDFVRSKHNLLTTVASRLDGKITFALEGSAFIAGAAVQWLRDGLAIIDSASASGDMAAEADATQSVVLVPAFSGLGAPYWEPNARGAMFGLNRNTGTREVARAALESVCFQARDLLSAMTAEYPLSSDDIGIRVDGGFVASDWAMQFQADILGREIDRPLVTETTALGAAWLAGQSLGLWPNAEGYGATWKLQRQFRPSMSENARNCRYAEWRAAVEATLMYTGRKTRLERSASEPPDLSS